jgi:hypothetical protein
MLHTAPKPKHFPITVEYTIFNSEKIPHFHKGFSSTGSALYFQHSHLGKKAHAFWNQEIFLIQQVGGNKI